MVKNLLDNAGDSDLILGSGSSPGEGNGNLLQCSCLENPMDRGAWRAAVHRITKSWTERPNGDDKPFFNLILKNVSLHVCV